MDAERQRQMILDQFTRQAIPFTELPAHSEEASNRLVIETAGITPNDTVLDVACGPGLITCEIAAIARRVTGIDLTPAMIEQAEKRQSSKGLANMDWRIGDVTVLPFDDASFSSVVTRYSFHHLLDPKAVLAEMVRVCQPGGKVTVVDMFTSSPEQADALNQVERLRDPSHVRALGADELVQLFEDAGLKNVRTEYYKVEMQVEKILAVSFPNPGDGDKVRQLFRDDVGVNRIGMGAMLKDGAVYYAYPIVIVVGDK
ncbi:class I SAM-dependent methyltransferase [Schlesneria paludicola]|uniref:class I SAM-dependent methyltransferase n=1 Tax=Schlesneria paludicola TaxID=360056 RepID=UPI000299DC96|nr:methyltransferase domain-containing protein [Schlesneria paludicola]